MPQLKKKHFKILLILLTVPVVFTLILFWLVSVEVFGVLPNKDDLLAIKTFEASQIYSGDGELIGTYHIQNRTMSSTIPDPLKNALIATEDARFYEHDGIDFRATLRVIFKTILMGDASSGGGSTLSQQLIKNLYPRTYHGFLSMPVAKFREIICAQRLEEVYSKDEIVFLYLNTVPFGDDIWGVETAAYRYFNKSIEDLTVEEAAVLVGMLKAPNYYHPVRNTESSKQRRNVVLAQEMKYGYLTENQFDSLKEIPLETDYQESGRNLGLAQHLREKVRLDLELWCKENFKKDGSAYNLYTDGLQIELTIDSKLQRSLEASVRKRMPILQERFELEWGNKAPYLNNSYLQPRIKQLKRYQVLSKKGLDESAIMDSLKAPKSMKIWVQGARKDTIMSVLDSLIMREKKQHCGAVSLDPKTGAVLAYVGGEDFSQVPYDYANTSRQVGSLFKPIVYYNALINGEEPCDYYSAETQVFEDYDNWAPSNGNDDSSKYSLAGALANSINTITAQLAIRYGLPELVALADSMGFRGELSLDPSIALGSGSSTVTNMAEVYSFIVNGGKRTNHYYIKTIKDKEGNVLFESKPKLAKTISKTSELRVLNSMLALVTDSGTARGLRTVYGIKSDVHSKTGTTQNNADAWYAAAQENLVTVVWVGANSPKVHFRYTSTGQGAAVSLPIFADYYRNAVRDKSWRSKLNAQIQFKSEPITCEVKRSGEPIKDFFGKIKGWFTDGEEPESNDSLEEDDSGLFKKIKGWFQRDSTKN